MQHTFNKTLYKDFDLITVNISDSFVHKNIKTGNGSGETRLYVSQQKTSQFRFFTFDSSTTVPVKSGNRITNYHPCPYRGYFLKANLLNYLNDSYTDYHLPAFSFNHSNIAIFYNENLRIVNELPDEIPFTIHNQNGKDDEFRFYIGSGDPIWHIVRAIALPFTSQYAIHKMVNPKKPNDMVYYFEVRKKAEDDTNSVLKKDFTPKSLIDLNHTLVTKSTNTTSDNLINDSLATEFYSNTPSVSLDFLLEDTETNRLITTRIGQSKFREEVLQIMPSCPFTGISTPALLRASHIIPWKDCATAQQRLDGYNGLTLTPTYDLLFDYGLISFTNTGQLLISSRLDDNIRTALNLKSNAFYNIYNTSHQRDNYLEFHRTYIFNK